MRKYLQRTVARKRNAVAVRFLEDIVSIPECNTLEDRLFYQIYEAKYKN